MEAPSSLPDSVQPPQPQPQPESQPQLQAQPQPQPQPQTQPQSIDPLNPQLNEQSQHLQQYAQQSNHIQDYYYQNPAQVYDQSYYAYYQQYPYQNQWQYPQQQQTYAYYQPDYSAAYSQPVSHPQETVPAVSAPYGGTQIVDAIGAPQQPQHHQQSAYPPVQTSGNSAVPPGMNPAAAAAITALQQLTQFAGSMDAAERALAGYPAYNASSGPVAMHPPVARHQQRGRGRRGGGIPPRGRGRGRGRGRSRHVEEKGMMSSSSYPQPTEPLANAAQPAPAPLQVAPNQRQVQIAWCELCRVDCSSFEILEQHKNGKRHKKNLLRFEEPKNNTKPEPAIHTNPEAAKQPQVSQDFEEQKADENLQAKSTSNEPVTENNQHNDATKLPEVPVETSTQQESKPRISKLDNRRQGLKRKMKGGRGGKRMRTSRAVEPPKPKVVIPLICELCNVKCDTQEVLGRHLSGKKHIAKLKRFEGHQAMYGSQGLQVLYPPNPVAQQTQFISQGHQQQPFGGYVGPLPSQGGGSFPTQSQQSTAGWTPQVYQSFVPQVPEATLTMEANPTAAI